MQDNRKHLDELVDNFKKWLHIEDPGTLHTLCAVKMAHKLPGDPVWMMLIGPSSDGKSEVMGAFTQRGEISIDSVTPNTFVSGYQLMKGERPIQFAELLANKIWYIYDFSIIMSKHADERGKILSDLRKIYDGRISKRYGTGDLVDVECPNSTLIVGCTPAIDSTILEDQILGTRWLLWRTTTGDRTRIMEKIDATARDLKIMRTSLNLAVATYEDAIEVGAYKMSEIENQNLQVLTNLTTIMRTSVELDRQKEARNLAYPEAPGRLYRQLKKMYAAYRLIGLTEVESIQAVRTLCLNSINPVRRDVVKYLVNNKKLWHNTTEIATACRMGKGHTKGELSALNALGLVDYKEETVGYKNYDCWWLAAGNFDLMLSMNNGWKPNKRGLSLHKLKVDY